MNKVRNKSIALTLALSATLACNSVNANESPQQLSVASFSSISNQQLGKIWQNYKFSLLGRSTHYQLISQDGRQVLRADSDKAASSLIRPLSVNLEQHPILNWRWQATNLPTRANDNSKRADDHSARLYVIFNSPETDLLNRLKNTTGLAATHALNYIWANQAAINTLLPNPYSEHSMMIAVNSGSARLGQWQSISRNVYADYQRAFGHKPPPVTAIAIMTDSDNTGVKLTTFYGDIHFSQQQPAK